MSDIPETGTTFLDVSPIIPEGKINFFERYYWEKIGMTSVYDPSDKQTACTVIEGGPCVVTQVKTKETDGYSALQISLEIKRKPHHANQKKPLHQSQ